jgi:two-component sensor histidine kinase
MQYPAHPAANEGARLAALASYDILDTPREQDFDDVAELASEICGTPIAVVNLIGEGRQFFKAEVGLGVRETPLDSSFCAKAILEEEFLVIPDATKDPRFHGNPLVTGEPGLRFYAGALLKTEDGQAIGTVCVLDFTPRNLSGVQERSLRVLARQVMKQLELRRALRDRDRAQAQQKVLNQELSHRLKNTLAMVQAIASQTLKGVSERDAVDAFERRIFALSKAHDVLLQENWAAAPIRNVIDLVLPLHGDPGKIEVDGPELQLGAKSTLSLSLILHELATNAIKYGALSNEAGRVALTWRVEANGAGKELVLSWHEMDGPHVEQPSHKGFGSRLIRMGLAGTGGTELRYLASGLRAEFKAPLELVQAQ